MKKLFRKECRIISTSKTEFELNDELLEKVNKFSRKKLTAEEIYAFPVVLCDNEVDRDFESFSITSLKKLSELFIGKTGIFDHNPKGENQTARIFDTEVITDPEKKTSAGEPYTILLGKAYMIRNSKNSDLISEIDGGIKKEVSVSCSVKIHRCSICNSSSEKNPCKHQKGKLYNGIVCHQILEEPYDAYEWSFVAVPAQRNAGVTKKFGDCFEDNDSAIKSLRIQLSQQNEIIGILSDELKNEVAKLGYICQPVIPSDVFKLFIDKMEIDELLHLKKHLSKQAEGFCEPQLFEKAQRKDIKNNQNFKLFS